VTALRPGRLFAAMVTAAVMALLLPLMVPPQRPANPARQGEELLGGVVDAAPPTTAPTPTTPPGAPRAPVDPGPDDVRSLLDAPRPAPPSTLEGYRWPLPNGRLTLPFGPSPWGSRIVDGERFHDGIDLATFCGDRVVAAHAGRVLAVGRRFDRFLGWRGSLARYQHRLDQKHAWLTLPIVVVIDDGNGYRSIYAHFSRTTVRSGQRVKAGQLIGYEGATGRASGCHLHYGLFSPHERAVFTLDPKIVKSMRLPATQTARIDPLLVLPERTKAAPKPAATPAPSASLPPGGHEGP
jgi:murein DD-endopeptidase MepM/ murein hydrolase activator NlpD